MFPNGTVYERGKSNPFGTVYLHASFKTRALYTLLRGIGAGLIGFVLITTLASFGPVIKQEVNYELNSKQYQNSQNNLLEQAKAQEIQAVRQEAESLGINSYFSLVIPKIGAKSNIVPNVDTADEKAYLDSLMNGVAHAKGTYFPGQGNKIYLFAHSTDFEYNISKYNAVFFLLRKLEPGDTITVFFADQKYQYQVTEKRVVDADDVHYLTQKVDEEVLVLQTCDPPGTTWKRLLVFAKPVAN